MRPTIWISMDNLGIEDIWILPLLLGAWVAQWVRYLDSLTTHTSLLPIRRGFTPVFVNYKKGCTRLAAASDLKLTSCLPMVGGSLRFPPTLKLVHDIAEILLKVALNTINQIKSNPLLLQFAVLFSSYIRSTCVPHRVWVGFLWIHL